MMVTIIANIIAVVVVVVIMLLLEVQQRRRQARLIAELRTMAEKKPESPTVLRHELRPGVPQPTRPSPMREPGQ